ncbi:MAG: hypothetical protein LBP92_13210 [Deltaproteobacteria bacterium]|jgi:hypothetical protein|nr:hypothetical protein [Deltaproteobacteria bacterium]
MKNIMLLPLILVCLFLVFSVPIAQAEEENVIFCKSFDNNFNPIDINTEFDTNQVSAAIRNAGDGQFKVMQMILSIYQNSDDSTQVLLHRENVDINPDWNVLYVTDIPLPNVGSYSFVVTSLEGQTFSSGTVVIKAKNVDKEMPENAKVEGATLKQLFEFYKEKAEPAAN